MNERIIPPHGGYRNLLSYQRAEVVYDATVRFCADVFDKRNRSEPASPESRVVTYDDFRCFEKADCENA